MSYYLRGEATGKIVDLSTFSGGAFDTRLEQALWRVATAAGASAGEVGYCHYGYPTANALMTIVGVRDDVDETFNFTIPSGLVVSETSWFLRNSESSSRATNLSLRESFIGSTFFGRPQYGLITSTLHRDVPMEVKVSDHDGSGAIVIVYGQ